MGVGPALHPHYIRLLVGDEVGEDRHERERENAVEAEHRQPVAPVLTPHEPGVALRAWVVHAALRSKEMRGSTSASSRSAIRRPTSVRNELIAKRPRTTG